MTWEKLRSEEEDDNISKEEYVYNPYRPENWTWRIKKFYYSCVHYIVLVFKYIFTNIKKYKEILLQILRWSLVIVLSFLFVYNLPRIDEFFEDPLISSEISGSWESEVVHNCKSGGSQLVIKKFTEYVLTYESGYETKKIEQEITKEISYCG